jgi:hypothetical protein
LRHRLRRDSRYGAGDRSSIEQTKDEPGDFLVLPGTGRQTDEEREPEHEEKLPLGRRSQAGVMK